MVDIDTSGPGADIEVSEEKTFENEVEVAEMKTLKTILSPIQHLRNLMR